MIFKIVFFTLIILLILVFVSPINVCIRFFDKLTVKIKFWFLCFNLTDRSPSKKENQNINSKEEHKNFFGDILKKRGLSGFIDLLKDVVAISSFLLKKVLKNIKIKNFNLNVNIASEDSAVTAIRYGRFCAILYPLISSLKSIVQIKDPCIDISPDFKNVNSSESTIEFTSDITISVFKLFTIAVLCLFYYTKRKRSFLNESTSN